MKKPKRCIWLCDYVKGLPGRSPGKLALSFFFFHKTVTFLLQACSSHSPKPLARVPSTPVWMFVLQFYHLHNSSISQKYKEESFLFSSLKCPMQDKALLNRMWPSVCGHSQHSIAAAPIPSHGAPSHPATSSSAWLHPSLLTLYAEGKQLWFLLLVLQQTALWTTAIIIKSLGKSMQIPAVLYIPTRIWAVCAEAKRAKQCFYVNNLSVSERLQCTEHSDAKKTLVQKPVAPLRALLIVPEAFRAPDHRSTSAVPALYPPPTLSFPFDL